METIDTLEQLEINNQSVLETTYYPIEEIDNGFHNDQTYGSLLAIDDKGEYLEFVFNIGDTGFCHRRSYDILVKKELLRTKKIIVNVEVYDIKKYPKAAKYDILFNKMTPWASFPGWENILEFNNVNVTKKNWDPIFDKVLDSARIVSSDQLSIMPKLCKKRCYVNHQFNYLDIVPSIYDDFVVVDGDYNIIFFMMNCFKKITFINMQEEDIKNILNNVKECLDYFICEQI